MYILLRIVEKRIRHSRDLLLFFFPSSFVITARYVLIDLIRKSTSHKYTEESWKNLGNLTR